MKGRALNAAVLANVDAGKTTLVESILYHTGAIRKVGRVDHGDAFLDTQALEKKRGITIFSKMAQISLKGRSVTLLDTPGHVDFSAETERTLHVSDVAILLISARDGVTGHTLTLWNLLSSFSLPVLIFVNKMDQPGARCEEILKSLSSELSDHCAAFDDPDFQENAAMCREDALENYLENGTLSREMLQDLFESRALFPVFFGSALKMEGVEEFLDGCDFFFRERDYPEEFGASCYKISRDEKGNRLTFLKIFGGSLKAREDLVGSAMRQEDREEREETEDEETKQSPPEKVNQIRIYSGEQFEQVPEAFAGQVIAVTGPQKTFIGQTYGAFRRSREPSLESVLSYDLYGPEEVDSLRLFAIASEIAAEIPEISPSYDSRSGKVHVRVMGEVQMEILEAICLERYQIPVHFGEGQVVYRETIQSTVEGVGHFEPLRHYAEVHLKLEPGERGSGIVYDSVCRTEMLAMNYQRLILAMLKVHRQLGVLIGAELTDVRVTLLGGRSHIKHTVGGDFRQAGRRALRQGLMQCESLLLEPYYRFSLDLPLENVGRALTDIEKMAGKADSPRIIGQSAHLTGSAPVSTIRNYAKELRAYSSGRGHLELSPGPYGLCHNAEDVIKERGYDPTQDLRNPPWSVFCAHGAGFEVPWDQVTEYMHVPRLLKMGQEGEGREEERPFDGETPAGEETSDGAYERYRKALGETAELMQIFERTYGPVKSRISEEDGDIRMFDAQKKGGGRHGPTGLMKPRKVEKKEEFLLVDGYNVIYDWAMLRELSKRDFGAARSKLADLLSNYAGYRKISVILVFDAYKVSGGEERVYKRHNIFIVFTREAETADRYIEKTVHRMRGSADLVVATSDYAEQVIVFGGGARRMSARELFEGLEGASGEIRESYLGKGQRLGNRIQIPKGEEQT